jgi:predicted DNA-binding ribbon-helix-helix protein
LVAGIDANRKQSNLSSAIRLFVLEHFQNKGLLQSGRATVSSDETQSTQT